MRSKIGVGQTQPTDASFPDLQVVIPHRTVPQTRTALKYASTFAPGLNVRLRLLEVHVVPYGVPLDEPTVDPKHLARKLRVLAQETTLPVSVEIIFSRDWEQGLRRSLAPGSVVVMAMKRSWWPTNDKRLAARLRRQGHQVMWVETD
jgi:hypothetical protein